MIERVLIDSILLVISLHQVLYWVYLWQLMRMTIVTHTSGLVTPIIGLLLCTPKYLVGMMTLGFIYFVFLLVVSVSAAAEFLPGVKRIHEGLVTRLQAVVDRFRAQRITLVSGYRPASLGSFHQSARAHDRMLHRPK